MKLRPKEIFSKINSSEKVPEMEEIKKLNPKLWKNLRKKFKTGRQISLVQLNNGLDQLNENILRMYLHDYVRRFLNYGPNSYPTSFNILEPFFTFNQNNSILELINDEEPYGVSLIDFLDFVTEPDFYLDEIDLFENIPEKCIYHFTFTTGTEEINFSNSKGKTFNIGGLSLVRQENEVSILLQTGESFNKKEAEEYFQKHTRKSIEDNLTPYKKSLGFKIGYEGESKVVNFLENEDLWLHSVAVLFDIETKSMDLRHVARDENISYHVLTDDFNALFSKQDSLSEETIKNSIERNLKELESYDAVFDFAKYCLALPYYVFQNEDKLVNTVYETSLNSIIKGPSNKREFASVPSSYKLFSKSFYYLESNSQFVIENKELNDDSFNLEKTGFWKRIPIDEIGFDKKGRKITGKTWVERNDIYYSDKKGVTKVTTTVHEKFDGENAGHIYIMRQPSHGENIFKVGLTKRTPEKRKNELSNTSSVDKFFIINSYKTKDCILAEKEIHIDLNKYRLTSRREFFRCELRIILDSCEKIIHVINK
jgi:hypothetical protein